MEDITRIEIATTPHLPTSLEQYRAATAPSAPRSVLEAATSGSDRTRW